MAKGKPLGRSSRRLITAQEAKELDKRAREDFGISTLVLMENAGSSVAEESLSLLRPRAKVTVFCGNTRSKMMLRCAIFCGKGNNGADGLVAARHLLARGIKADIFLAGSVRSVKNEARVNLDIILKLKQRITEVEEANLHLVKNKVSRCRLIIDALLGVGLSGEVKGVFRDLIGIINSAKAYVLSVDIPSGLDATTGETFGCCVKADKTVTFMAKKLGMVVGEGRKYCGSVVVKNLGIPL